MAQEATPIQKVVVVNGNTEVMEKLETVLEAGRYDMVLLESDGCAYSQIRKVKPNLVILCANLEYANSLDLLTMLKIDPETKDIPVLTCAMECEGRDFDSAISELCDDDEEDGFPDHHKPLRMN